MNTNLLIGSSLSGCVASIRGGAQVDGSSVTPDKVAAIFTATAGFGDGTELRYAEAYGLNNESRDIYRQLVEGGKLIAPKLVVIQDEREGRRMYPDECQGDQSPNHGYYGDHPYFGVQGKAWIRLEELLPKISQNPRLLDIWRRAVLSQASGNTRSLLTEALQIGE